MSCNRAAELILNQSSQNLPGKRIQDHLLGLPDDLESLPCEFRLHARRATGQQFPIQVSVSEFPSQTEKLFIAIVRDSTISEQAEQERLMMARETEALRAQQMTTLAQLATGVAHEIRNPLTCIKMLIQVNRSKFAIEGLPTDDLELVEQEIRRMERSINSLLDFARPEQAEFIQFAIQEAIQKTHRLVEGRCQAQKVVTSLEVPVEPVFVFGDSSQIQQLLLNLALNALDAIPTGGRLTISVAQLNRELEILVLDSGAGIESRVLERLFAPFVTTKPNGIGLGLGICRRIADAHGGTLAGSNRSCGGAQFRLKLPIATENNTPAVLPPAIETPCKAC